MSLSGNVKQFKKKGYESINRDMLQDVDNLSLQAIGLLCNLSSMPDSWTIYKTELYKRYARNGRTSVQNAWDELVENNYIVQFRKRNGRKFDYYYYFSQEKFTTDDIKLLEEKLGCSLWDGKASNKKENKKANDKKASSHKPKEGDSTVSTVDFEQSKMDSPKSTDNRLTIKEINHQDNNLDTKDTINDTVNDSFHKHFSYSLTDSEKEKLKEKYMEEAFYENEEKIPKRIANMLQVFSDSPEQAKKYYNIILLAKSNAEKDLNEIIWLEHEPELVHKIVNTFSRAIRKFEKERNVKNKNGYIYRAIYDLLAKEISYRSRKNFKSNGVYYNWLEDFNEKDM